MIINQKLEMHYESAFLASAIGDALGWPLEFSRGHVGKITNYVAWTKRAGGRYWGYAENIRAGEYSDDTQLALVTARCINEEGFFEPERFAYLEYPLWLHYERGGGRAVKAAAHKLLQKKTVWQSNFYHRQKDGLNYRTAGANGAAMRIFPIALVNIHNTPRLVLDIFHNSIISHGHPRAIIGALTLGLAIQFVLNDQEPSFSDFKEYILEILYNSWNALQKDSEIAGGWALTWNHDISVSLNSIQDEWNNTINEVRQYLDAIEGYIESRQDYFRFVGALNPDTKSSGISTVCAAIYCLFKFQHNPQDALSYSANMVGSDTDTISAMLGGLLGAQFGLDVLPSHLVAKVQDSPYLREMGKRLFEIANGNLYGLSSEGNLLIDKKALLQKLFAWEVGLHEMFWDAIDINGIVYHPALGRGTIEHKEIQPIQQKNYVAKLIRISFDCGQTCIFHSRVKDNGKVDESLSTELIKSLYG